MNDDVKDDVKFIQLRELILQLTETNKLLLEQSERQLQVHRKILKVVHHMSAAAASDFPYFRKEEVMCFFDKTERSVQRWIVEGKLIPVRVGDSVLFRKADVYALLQKAYNQYIDDRKQGQPMHNTGLIIINQPEAGRR